MDEKKYFLTPSTIAHKQYEALRAFFVDDLSAKAVATQFGYTYRAFTSLVADFRKAQKDHPEAEPFFQMKRPGRKAMPHKRLIVRLVVALRKQYFSVPDS